MIEKRPVAIVTGGTGEIGQAIVQKIARRGFRVLIPYRDKNKWEVFVNSQPLSDTFAYEGFQLDLTSEQDVQPLIENVMQKYGHIDALVHCAGAYTGGDEIAKAMPEQWRHMWESNVLTAVNVARAVLPRMKERQKGVLIFISAEIALQVLKGTGPYSASKRALLQMADTLAKEAAPYHIRVNTLLPGMVATDANLLLMSEKMRADAVTPEEIADTVGFLLSPGGSSLNGSHIRYVRS